MNGRVLGDITLPPASSTEWSLKPNTIYGCPLCHLINNGLRSSELWTLDGDIKPINGEIHPLNYHGTSVSIEDIKQHTRGPVSICVSMGHLYLKPGNLSPGRQPLRAMKITILDKDLPEGNLIYFREQFYNFNAKVAYNTEADQRLDTITSLNRNLKNARDLTDYTEIRLSLIEKLEEYLLPRGISLDTEYALTILDKLVSEIPANTSRINLNLAKVQGGFGTVYIGRFVNDDLVYKYLDISDREKMDLFLLEQKNNHYIRKNMKSRANLPYPYMLNSYTCGQIDAIKSLSHPTCPQDAPQRYGVIVMSYIDNIGTVFQCIKQYGIPLYVESLATLAEAHQGDTVQHHFMHMDAQSRNLLVSKCARICSSHHWRMCNFGGMEYNFGTHGYHVYLTDFGYSHFLEEVRNHNKGYAPNTVVLDSTLYPAYDLISFTKTTLPVLVISLLKKPITHIRRKGIMLLKLTACVLAEQIVEMTYRNDVLDTSLHNQTEVNPFNLESLIVHLSSYHRQPIETVQQELIRLVDSFCNKLRHDTMELDSKEVYDVLKLFSGIVIPYRGEGRQYIEKFNDKTYYQQYIPRLSPQILTQLGISKEPPEMITGIPLYLWYMNASGITTLNARSIN